MHHNVIRVKPQDYEQLASLLAAMQQQGMRFSVELQGDWIVTLDNK
jgi:hypothetical protein